VFDQRAFELRFHGGDDDEGKFPRGDLRPRRPLHAAAVRSDGGELGPTRPRRRTRARFRLPIQHHLDRRPSTFLLPIPHVKPPY
jgi:hypothetical protein